MKTQRFMRVLMIMVMASLSLIVTAQADLNDGLVAYYPFNGNANDESGKGHHGTVTGATLTADRNGKANSAYSFDGVDDVIKTSSVNWDLSSKATVCAWIKASASGAILSLSHDYVEDEILLGPVWSGNMCIFN
ncbi:MAG: hypothetical protein HQK74_01480, partial [Desulfamplus sp.]|nr:hypothetical protein [Desulfamplus sp.]